MDPTIGTSRNLGKLIEDYDKFVSGEYKGKQFQEKKSEVADRVMEILLILVKSKGGLANPGIKALLDFRNKISKQSDDIDHRVIECIDQFAERNFSTGKKIEQMFTGAVTPQTDKVIPEDVKKVIDVFEDISHIDSLPREKKLERAYYAMRRLNDAKTETPIKYENLVHFTQIVTKCWDELSTNDQSEATTSVLYLKNHINPSDTEIAKPFKESVLALFIKSKYIPEEIQTHTGYHGKNIDEGKKILEDLSERTILARKDKLDDNDHKIINERLNNFPYDYSTRFLKDVGEYLIRKSSKEPIIDDKGNYNYPFSLSIIDGQKELSNMRLVRIESKDAKVSWKSEISEKAFDSIDDLIKSIFNKPELAKVKAAPSLVSGTKEMGELIQFIKSKYHVESWIINEKHIKLKKLDE
jgi:hypothetical protein